MKRKHQFVAILLLIAALQLTACAKQPEAAPEAPPAQVEHLNGKEVTRVTLTADADRRIGIKTDTARAENSGEAARIIVPYASILYDTEGHAWVYTSPKALTYMRTPVEVEMIRGEDAILVDGPAAGTNVVTVGAEELFGSETEFEEE
jgi:hypothetical protein